MADSDSDNNIERFALTEEDMATSSTSHRNYHIDSILSSSNYVPRPPTILQPRDLLPTSTTEPTRRQWPLHWPRFNNNCHADYVPQPPTLLQLGDLLPTSATEPTWRQWSLFMRAELIVRGIYVMTGVENSMMGRTTIYTTGQRRQQRDWPRTGSDEWFDLTNATVLIEARLNTHWRNIIFGRLGLTHPWDIWEELWTWCCVARMVWNWPEMTGLGDIFPDEEVRLWL